MTIPFKSMSVSEELARNLEIVEIKAWTDFYRSAPEQLANDLGIFVESSASTCSTIVSKIDVLAFNRAIGMGLEVPLSNSMITAQRDLFENKGVSRFFIQMCPVAASQRVIDLLLSHRFKHHNNWVKLIRDTSEPASVETDLRVEQIGPDRARDFASILVTSFEWPDIFGDWIESAVGLDNWRFYLAFDGAEPVATGAIYINGEYGWIDFASTLQSHRGRGAQGAILTRRIKDAAAAGCKWLTVETAEQTPEKSAPSYRNMLRFGFEVAYLRANYIYTFE